MATEILSAAGEESFFSSVNVEEKTACSEVYSSLDKLTKAVGDLIELRAALYMQTEEKIQQYQQNQLQKLNDKEEHYMKKRQELENNISDYMSQIKDVEYSCFEVKEKISTEKGINMKLKDEISNLKTEKDNMNVKFQKTLSLYSTVTQWYENYLKIYIDINKEDKNIITFYFNSKKYNATPYVKFEVSGDCTYKLLEAHSAITNDKENFKEVYNAREIISFICSTQERLKVVRKSLKKMPDV